MVPDLGLVAGIGEQQGSPTCLDDGHDFVHHADTR